MLIFVPRRMPHICQVFGSRYSQVKLEGPLHIPGIYQNVVGLEFAGIRLVDEVYTKFSFIQELVYLFTKVILILKMAYRG